MISSVNSLSSSSISLLFGPPAAAQTNTGASTIKLLTEPSGATDASLRTGDAIGNIIEIASKMGKTDTQFQMTNAERVYAADGAYSETSTGTGTVGARKAVTDSMMEAAKEAGPKGDRARAYLSAVENGTVQSVDMASFGVTSTMTVTKYYHADGTDKGQQGSYDTKGIDSFVAEHVIIKDDMMFDKATGNYASISQNGTQFTYNVWPK